MNDISTTFTRPKNYIEHIVGGAVFVREKWDTPMGEVYPVKIADLDKRLEGIQQATLKLYSKFSKMPRRTLIYNGMYVYYIDMILPHLRLAGTYEKACKRLRVLGDRPARRELLLRHRQARLRAGDGSPEDLLRRGLSAVPGQCEPEPLEILLEVGASAGALPRRGRAATRHDDVETEFPAGCRPQAKTRRFWF